ncbi:hypothetical protein M3Y99_00337400 [Aphelenchoides fujianensis]|nr:hypothetical protein M3Y99_00337400 [Aphelenchoides fujianensis]
MSSAAVRPQREPTGTQKRRKRSEIFIKEEQRDSPSSASEYAIHTPRPESDDRWFNPWQAAGEQADFERLVFMYGEHLRFMNRSLITPDDFLAELSAGVRYAAMTPKDVDRLSSVELGGLLYWIERLEPFTQLAEEDRNRYSVRKLSLDHFYVASKHPEAFQANNFMLNSNRYVNELSTGFEMESDSDSVRRAKFRLLRPTIDLSLAIVIRPFYELKVSDAEITFLHLMLMWSTSNNQHVKEATRTIMKERRDWAINRLFTHYQQRGDNDGVVRLGEILLLLGALECVCQQHVKDFQVAQLFKMDNLSQYWYENVCYNQLNIEA